MIRFSQAIIKSCSFSNDSAISGYGGAISSENVANVTVQESSFDNCKASYGGSVSVESGSTLKLEHSNVTDSSALNAGGGLYIFQNSFVTGHNITITDGKSPSGGGFYVAESSEINLNIFKCLENSASETGGALYCRKGEITLEKGTLIDNSAREGGGIFGENCCVVFDYVQIVKNTSVHLYYHNGGGMYFKASEVEIHNSEGVNNNARNFAVIEMNSKFKSNYLHLPDAEWNCIDIFSSSKAEMKHTSLGNINWDRYTSCTFRARFDSNINLDSVYYTYLNYTRRTQDLFKNYKGIVCTDDTSSASMIEG